MSVASASAAIVIAAAVVIAASITVIVAAAAAYRAVKTSYNAENSRSKARCSSAEDVTAVAGVASVV